MPSLADIPNHLIDASMRLDFLNWLTQIAMDAITAKQFMRLWSGATQRTFDSEDWNFVIRQIELKRGY